MDTERGGYIRYLLNCIRKQVRRPVCLMEVCGTHTVAIARSGLKELLPPQVRLLSGPGCPVCVTDEKDIDAVISLAFMPKVTIATYGDMIRVPGSMTSLQNAKADGADVRLVYSAMDALTLAKTIPDREVVLLGVGFETTAPTVAVALEQAIADHIHNFSIFSVHKAVPPVLDFLLRSASPIDGFLLPGHVCTVTGVTPFRFIADQYRRSCVVTGFEPDDILEAVLMLLIQLNGTGPKVEIQYRRAVQPDGNAVAQHYLHRYFTLDESEWRGIGRLQESGYILRDEFRVWDARNRFSQVGSFTAAKRKSACICGEILKGTKQPAECRLFAQTCRPSHPVGPCMVSHEGACAAAYHFGVKMFDR